MEHQADMTVIADNGVNNARGACGMDIELNARIALGKFMQWGCY